MAEVVISNDDITVLGPPDVLELLVDIGATGERGSIFFVGSGDPNSLTSDGRIFQKTINLYDMYINTSPGVNYGYLYQYKNESGGNAWYQVLRVNPTLYSKKYSVTFSTGSGSIVIPISSIATVSGTPLTASNFNVQYSIENTFPIASSVQIPALTGSGDNLVINLKAAKYQSSAWSDLSGEVVVNLFISIVI
jgi:hypothetical protein